jgi:hypothetical protein
MLGQALIREAGLIREEAMDGRAGGDGLERLAP